MDLTFVIRSKETRSAALKAVSEITSEPLMEVVIREHTKTRTDGQNRRYWADLTGQILAMNADIEILSQHTGYSNIEARRLVAKTLQPEEAAILFCRTPEAAHEILKLIAGIPTSTRLGTKKFAEFEDRMVQIVADIVGTVRAFG